MALPAEIILVWLLYLLDVVAILLTYSRIPAHELYHVSHGGLAGGASRALVFSNFSMALAVIAVTGALYERLTSRIERAIAILAVVLCAAVVWPGVVDQANLDARPVNAIAAFGVVVALALTLRVAARGVARSRGGRTDAARAIVAIVLVCIASPWIAAELGFFLDGVPLLGWLFETGKHVPNMHGLPPFPPAVHHGHHHGMDGLLLVLTALLLSRVLPRRLQGLRTALTAYLALIFCYGVGNIANDFWLEQVVKRGWTTWQIPNVLEPRITVAWAIIVACAAAISAAAIVRERPSVS
jgi:hypothetical protein